jgi:lysozyme family protein
MTRTMLNAILYTQEQEGGFVDDPKDHGGATNKGITLNTLKDASAKLHGHLLDPIVDGTVTVEDLKNLSMEQLEEIVVVEGYWPDMFDHIDALIALKTFDFGFNMGVRSAVKLLQQSVNWVNQDSALPVDGIPGNRTMAAVNVLSPRLLLPVLISQAKNHYNGIAQRDPSQQRFLKGWLARAERLPLWATRYVG